MKSVKNSKIENLPQNTRWNIIFGFMTFVLIAVFILGYFAIAFENTIKLDKAASALLTGVLCWGIYFLNASDKEILSEELMHHFSGISSILFFLLSAMVVVELID